MVHVNTDVYELLNFRKAMGWWSQRRELKNLKKMNKMIQKANIAIAKESVVLSKSQRRQLKKLPNFKTKYESSDDDDT